MMPVAGQCAGQQRAVERGIEFLDAAADAAVGQIATHLPQTACRRAHTAQAAAHKAAKTTERRAGGGIERQRDRRDRTTLDVDFVEKLRGFFGKQFGQRGDGCLARQNLAAHRIG